MHCYCGRIAQLKTSWTSDNPGRRFQTYPSICARATAIIPGLLRRFKARDEEIHGLKKRTRMMGAMLVFLLCRVLR
ncbi:hypothetical protein CDL12_19819 [Handroanthus impetiginosus]|uniref:Uncharacterized protein n=1 Tax=Handroanthus impetiginosus TaxID=429701 RepID=A0A2G9GQW5_9LAMI|nr:hypothetical protein CDL12_19819 [Handroanthus impetiginosus]